MLLKLGLVTTRKKLAVAFGAPDAADRASQNGIVPMRTSKKVFVFSDPKRSQDNGYTFDGWAKSDEDGPVFHYTGTGPTGNQILTGLNGTVLNHEAQELDLHLFISEPGPKSGGGKDQRYVGQMRVDDVVPVVERWSKDSTGTLRRLYVFRLRPVDGAKTDVQDKDRTQPAAKTDVVRVKTPAAETKAALLSTEQHATDETVVHRSAGSHKVIRAEGKLSSAFEEFLVAQGHTVERYQITIKGERDPLVTDLYDVTDHVLYEAKGKTTRSNVRMALGQLLDYRRHIPQQATLRVAVLLPTEPTEDVRDIITQAGTSLVVRHGAGFTGYPLT